MNAAERAQRRAELRRRYRERKARELEDLDDVPTAIVVELAADVRAGKCACGCKRDLPPSGVRAVYVEGHRQRWHRRRLELLAEARGLPPRLSVHALEEGNRTSDRHGDAHAPRKRRRTGPRPGVTVYLPTVAIAEALVRELGDADAPDEVDDQELDVVDGYEAILAALERRRARPA